MPARPAARAAAAAEPVSTAARAPQPEAAACREDSQTRPAAAAAVPLGPDHASPGAAAAEAPRPPAGAAPPLCPPSTWEEGVTQAARLLFANCATEPLVLEWVDYEGRPREFAVLGPGDTSVQSSWSTHRWRLVAGGKALHYRGPSADVMLLPGGRLHVAPPERVDSWRKPEWGEYQRRGEALGIPIKAWECVAAAAVAEAARVLERMLAGAPPGVLQRLAAAGVQVAIIGRHQLTSDIPEHRFVRRRPPPPGAAPSSPAAAAAAAAPGAPQAAPRPRRDLDATARGLGATAAVPLASCGEENLLMDGDAKFYQESILIHEVGHAVMDIGLSEEERSQIAAAYEDAKRSGTYDPACYMMENASEYWAEGTQIWFDATARVDVNSGVNTRERLRRDDPSLARLLERALPQCPGRVRRLPYTFPLVHACVKLYESSCRPALLPTAPWLDRAARTMRRAAALLLLVALCGIVSTYAAAGSTVMDLDGLTWGVTNGNGSISLRSKLPAYPINLLQSEGIIQDPLYRFGELETRWVAMDTWHFAAAFTAPPDLLGRGAVDLVLDGVDTFATVTLNGHLVASLENFHRRYTLPVKRLLQSGANTLAITLHPAIPITVDRKKNHPYWIPTVTQLGNIDAYNFARKPAYDFGWDWGPGLAASGIFGGVSLLGYDTAVLKTALVTQAPAPGGGFVLRVDAELLSPPGGASGSLSVELPAVPGARGAAKVVTSEAGLAAVPALEVAVPAGGVELWWPVGYGAQPLYDVVVTFTPAPPAAAEGEAEAAAAAASSLTRRVGFRTIELVEKPLASAAAELLAGAGGGWENSVKPGGGSRACAGQNNCGQYGWVDGKKWTFISEPLGKAHLDDPVSGFDFPGAYPNSSMPGGDNPWWNQKLNVNGVPIYAKGANIIPFHTLPVNATPELIAHTVDLALDSRMNMLRVWGGGWYMPDLFYDLADEKGILIWQETMFACASYPRDDNFMSEVKAEVEQQVRRISSHPSVAIWGGNNEIETSLEWYKETQNNPALFVHDYTELFVAAIGGLMDKLVPGTPYVDSSPSNGVVSRKPFIKRWGGAWDPRYGDVHHYDYYADCQNFKTYPMAKFVSEHGWPSFPTWATFKAATSEEDWAVGAPGMEFRQRHYNKTMEMTNQYRKHFKLPATWAADTKGEAFGKWKRYLYLNHVQQALCIDTAFGYWRRLRSEPKGLTMGILLHARSHPRPDHQTPQGRYKPMQYRVKHQFKDFVVQTVLDGGHAQVFVVSDDTQPTKATLDLAIYRLAAPAACPAAAAAAAANGTDDARRPVASPAGAVWRKRVTVPVPALNAAIVLNASVPEILRSVPGCSEASCFLRATATTEPTKSKPAQISSSDLFFAQFKDLALAPPKITTSAFAQDGPNAVSFELGTAGAAALLVFAESEVKGRFDDNLMNLPPCGAVKMTFRADKGAAVTPEELKASLTVATLYENQADAPPAGAAAAAPAAPKPPVLGNELFQAAADALAAKAAAAAAALRGGGAEAAAPHVARRYMRRS
ncbi:MAG: hypothetical protein J3K34DRAFT_499330 [Monoraphidium minutum]|nr:MAG: hypothetical protein J3K34DRAFT_499330 [Monoraphidium minutum]